MIFNLSVYQEDTIQSSITVSNDTEGNLMEKIESEADKISSNWTLIKGDGIILKRNRTACKESKLLCP